MAAPLDGIRVIDFRAASNLPARRRSSMLRGVVVPPVGEKRERGETAFAVESAAAPATVGG